MKRFATTCALAALALFVVLIAPGCGSSVRSDLGAGFGEDRARRLIEAQRLAERAERTEDVVRREELLREAVGLFPQHSPYWTNLGTALAEQNDFGGAGEAYRVAADLDPLDPRPPYNQGLLYLKRGWGDQALEYFERSLDRDPNYLNAVRGTVKTRVRIRDYDGTLSELLDRAIILERDEEWIDYFRRQRVLVRGELGLDLDPDDADRTIGNP